MKRVFLVVLLVTVLAVLAGCAPPDQSQPAADPTLQTAVIQNKGSDTMVNLALAWAEAYQEINPQVRISVTGGGTGTGIAALINGTVDLANASREIKAEEMKAALANGSEPVEFIAARDAIAVIVNLHNPVSELTLQQVADIYSGKINNWSEVGGEDRPIVRLSRETNSGTHVYFLEEVLRMGIAGDKTLFSTDTLLLPSSEGIIVEVRDNPNAIGYDGLGYVVPEVKVIALGRSAHEPYILPSAATVAQGSYPISRDLYIYTVGQPTGATLSYLQWILSTDGQNIVIALGFVPIASP
jgi:phosphate transport system substrate-binding protein